MVFLFVIFSCILYLICRYVFVSGIFLELMFMWVLSFCLLKDRFIKERGLLISFVLVYEGERRFIFYFFKFLILLGIMIIGKVSRER